MKACFDNFCRSDERMRLHCEFDSFVGAPADDIRDAVFNNFYSIAITIYVFVFFCIFLLYCKILYCIVSSYFSLFFVFCFSVFSAYVANKLLHIACRYNSVAAPASRAVLMLEICHMQQSRTTRLACPLAVRSASCRQGVFRLCDKGLLALWLQECNLREILVLVLVLEIVHNNKKLLQGDRREILK